MITAQQYLKNMVNIFDRYVEDALDPQRLQTALGANVSDYYGETNRNPLYPSTSAKLNLVTGNLFKAATVYKAKGNVSELKKNGTIYTFAWGIDLDVIPYARIHEYGGMAGRNLMTRIPARPYITPAIKDFQEGTLPKIIEIMLRKLAQAAS